jgi:hypothetical protein
MAYATHREGLYAIDLKEGEIRWQSSRVNGNHLAVVGNSLFATTSTRWIKTGLVQLDLETKRLERKLRLEEDVPFSVRDGVLYVYRKRDEFAAIDLVRGSGELAGGGCQIEVKKFGTEWAPISIGGFWIS